MISYSALNPVNFLEGPQIDPTYLPKTTPFDTVGDYENYIRRLELHPTQVNANEGFFSAADGTYIYLLMKQGVYMRMD